MSKPKIHKRVVTVTVFSEDEMGADVDLIEIAHQINEGDWIGQISVGDDQVVEGKREIRKELLAIGNDGEFFMFITNPSEAVQMAATN